MNNTQEKIKYRVGRYFDSIFEVWETGLLSKEEAKGISAKLYEEKGRCYVNFQVQEVK